MSLPLFMSLSLNGLSLAMLYFLIAAGFSLIFGLMSVLNLAHASFFLWGAYSGLAIFTTTGNFTLAVIGATIVGVIMGLLVEYLTLRPLYGNHLFQILMTLGLLLVFEELVKLIWGTTILGFPRPEILTGSLVILGRYFPVYRLFIIIAGIVVFIAVYLILNRTKIGITVRAGVEDEGMVQALGIDIRKVFSGVFGLGAGLAALGGVIGAPFLGVYPELGFEMLVPALIVVIIGGLGSFHGSFVGAVIIGLSQSFGGYFIPEFALAINVALLAIVLLIKPTGLFGIEGGH